MTDRLDHRLLYWFDAQAFEVACADLATEGYQLRPTTLTPCQVLRTHGRELVYATPEAWSRMCKRQGSWYRESNRQGDTMIMADHRLPERYDGHLELEMSASDFLPEALPERAELAEIEASPEYQRNKPEAWEGVKRWEGPVMKLFFALTRFWRRKEDMGTYWLHQKANHANFLARRRTTEIDGEEVPYSITTNAGVCSSCVQFFGVMKPEERKLVRACPGSVTFGGAERDVYYDVRPVSVSP